MSRISGGGEIAQERLERFLTTKQINGVSCTLRTISKSYWGAPLNPGWYGIPDGNKKFAVALAEIRIDDWLKIQGETRPNLSQEDFEKAAYPDPVTRAKESAENGNLNEIPTPVMEIHYSDYLVKTQEGRSRAVGAKFGGETMMPIWIAAQEYR